MKTALKILPQHRRALHIFRDLAGKTVTWRTLENYATKGVRLCNRAKGIYKPAYTHYALSVKQTLKGWYPDSDIEQDENGRWIYRYFQEGMDPFERDKFASNRGLMACMEDSILVGVLIQKSPKPNVQYRVLGLAEVVDWDDGYFFLRESSDLE